MVIVAGTSFGDTVEDWASKPIEHYKDLEASVGLEQDLHDCHILTW